MIATRRDWYRLQYRVLEYLYSCMNSGKDPDKKEILGVAGEECDSYDFFYSLKYLAADRLIDGFEECCFPEIYTEIFTPEKLKVTTVGIEYLQTSPDMIEARISRIIG